MVASDHIESCIVRKSKGNHMSAFWVVGGEYRNTRFDEFAEGQKEERYGPFPSYDAARREWQQRSWAQVDNCNVRYRILEDETVG